MDDSRARDEARMSEVAMNSPDRTSGQQPHLVRISPLDYRERFS